MASLSTVDADFKSLEDERHIPLIVLGSVSSFLSILGSSCVIHMSSKKLHKIMHRLVFCLSISDMIASLASLFMPYMVPLFMGLPGAVGNHEKPMVLSSANITAATCQHGFLMLPDL